MASHEAEASDTESINELLSPRDGYFNPNSVPNEVLVPDPAQRNTLSDKEREAREALEEEQRRASEAQPSASAPQHHRRAASSSSIASSTRTRIDPDIEEDVRNESAPLMPSAPPAYADATRGSPPYNPSRAALQSPTYNTMEQGPMFLRSGAPEDMSDSRQPLLAEDPSGNRSSFSWATHRKSKLSIIWKFLIGAFVLSFLVLIIVTIVSAMMSGTDRHDGNSRPGKPKSGSPSGPSGDPGTPANGRCSQARYERNATMRYHDSTQFRFYQSTKNVYYPGAGPPIDISGEVRIKTAPLEEGIHARIDLQFYYSNEYIMEATEIRNPEDDVIRVLLPSHIPPEEAGSEKPCINVQALLWLAPNIEPSSFSITTGPLDVIIEQGVSMSPLVTEIRTASGSVQFPRNSPIKDGQYRTIVVHTGSGSIKGAYPLYDLLSLYSGSGRIDVDVTPKPASSAQAPAVLEVVTESGQIDVTLPPILTHQAPDRIYKTTIKSQSGQIQASNLLHGTVTTLRTQSGMISATIAPFGALDERSAIEITTQAGAIDARIFPHVLRPSEPMRSLNGLYKSRSGQISLQHPLQWEGKMEARSMDGGIDLDWPGMKIVRRGQWVGNHVYGSKGKGNGRIDVETTNGRIKLLGAD